MSVSSSLFMLLLLVAVAVCDVNFYPYYGRTGVSGGGQVLITRPHVQQTASFNRITLLDADHVGFGGFVSRPVMHVPHVVGSPVVIGSDSFDSSDIYADDRVVLIG